MLLFEYGEWAKISDREELEATLGHLWRQRIFVDPTLKPSEVQRESRFQPFVSFDGNYIRANNYAGFIQFESQTLEIFPKVFRTVPGVSERKDLMLRHIFFWFDYCRNWRFPFTRATLDELDIDNLPELIIYLIANQFLDAISTNPLSMYQPFEEALEVPRGSINFKRYVINSFSHGYLHKLECDYEPFLYDNKFNRLIKFCARLLLHRTRLSENVRILQEINFVLCDVEDVVMTASDLLGIHVNPLFEDYLGVFESCRFILNQQLYSSNSFELPQWCLLFPMNYIFEDFLAGFLNEYFRDRWRVEYQKSDQTVSDRPKAFQMQHDVLLTSRDVSSRQILVDAKYKLRDRSDVTKRGISQADLYQMITYATKRGCNEVLLLYPNVSESLESLDRFEIDTHLGGKATVRVTALDIPFWSIEDFDGLVERLRERMEGVLSLDSVRA